MRIVSQDKQKDIPYDDMIICLSGDRSIIIYSLHNQGDIYSSIGVYPSKERSLEVMQEIRDMHHEIEYGSSKRPQGDYYYMPKF